MENNSRCLIFFCILITIYTIFFYKTDIIEGEVGIESADVVDCEGEWSDCTAECEVGTDRRFEVDIEPSASGEACPTSDDAPDCLPGEDACPSNTDCVGSWSACTSDCVREWNTTTEQSGTGVPCPASNEAPDCSPGEDECPSSSTDVVVDDTLHASVNNTPGSCDSNNYYCYSGSSGSSLSILKSGVRSGRLTSEEKERLSSEYDITFTPANSRRYFEWDNCTFNRPDEEPDCGSGFVSRISQTRLRDNNSNNVMQDFYNRDRGPPDNFFSTTSTSEPSSSIFTSDVNKEDQHQTSTTLMIIGGILLLVGGAVALYFISQNKDIFSDGIENVYDGIKTTEMKPKNIKPKNIKPKTVETSN